MNSELSVLKFKYEIAQADLKAAKEELDKCKEEILKYCHYDNSAHFEHDGVLILRSERVKFDQAELHKFYMKRTSANIRDKFNLSISKADAEGIKGLKPEFVLNSPVLKFKKEA